MPSFDIVNQVDLQEVDNALNQAGKEIAQRYDFKNTATSVAFAEDRKSILIQANSEGRLQAAVDVLQSRLVKRGVSLKALTLGSVEPAAGGSVRQTGTLQQGIPVEKEREIVKHLKESKLKVQASIQGDQLRVSGKSRDELQSAIQLVRELDVGLELQFVNFRD
jgi:uncharacterized protein YajQ (UPF0234 family)